MSTARNEKYQCTLPRRKESNNVRMKLVYNAATMDKMVIILEGRHVLVFQDENGAYAGPSPIELLAPLFNQFVCTFKVQWVGHWNGSSSLSSIFIMFG